MLRRDGRYNAFLRFLDAQGNDYTRDPFASALPDGRLGPGGTKRGYVFFVRPEGVPFTGFLASGNRLRIRPPCFGRRRSKSGRRKPNPTSCGRWRG